MVLPKSGSLLILPRTRLSVLNGNTWPVSKKLRVTTVKELSNVLILSTGGISPSPISVLSILVHEAENPISIVRNKADRRFTVSFFKGLVYLLARSL